MWSDRDGFNGGECLSDRIEGVDLVALIAKIGLPILDPEACMM